MSIFPSQKYKQKGSQNNRDLNKCTSGPNLGTCAKFQLDILNVNVISGMVYFCEIILGSSQNISETTPWLEWVTSYHLVKLRVDTDRDTRTHSQMDTGNYNTCRPKLDSGMK